MKNNINHNLDISKKTCKDKDKLKFPNSPILYKSYNNIKNKNKANYNSNIQELSDIKTIVKNSVEKIYDLFSLKGMKDNSKIKSNDINYIKDKNNNENIKENIKYKEDNNVNVFNDDNNIMKTNITFKINNYLNVVNKNKNRNNDEENNCNGKTNILEDDNSYLYKRYNLDEKKENKTKDINNLKKNKKKKELKKNNSSNYNFMKNKNNIKNNILISSKINKNLINNIENKYNENLKNIYENKEYNNLNESKDNNNKDNNNNIHDKSIIVNTKYKKEDININDYIIKPTRISHINKENETTINNNEIINESKERKINLDSGNKNNNERRKKYMFLKRTKNKNITDSEKNTKNKMIFSQKNSKIKYQLSNSRINNNNLYNTKDEFYLKKEKLFRENNDENINMKDIKNEINNNKKNNNNSKKNNLCINISNKKKSKIQNYNYFSPYKNNNIKNINISKQNKYIRTANKSININNLLISNSTFPHYLSQKCKSDNKLMSSINQNIKKINNTNLLIDNDIKNTISRNKNRISTSRLIKDNKILNLLEKRNFSTSANKLKKNKDRDNIRKTLQKLYDTKFPNKVLTNDIIKLFLLLNEYIINNNLLSDYHLKNNKDILNKLSELLSKYSLIDYPKEYDINIDNYINNVKTIQRIWRKYKMKQLLDENEEIHELKKIVVNNYITKAGYKLKKMLGLFNSLIEEFNNIKNSDDINRMFFYVKNLIKRDLTTYEKNMIIKEFINVFINLK